jgi:hypothetical protein
MRSSTGKDLPDIAHHNRTSRDEVAIDSVIRRGGMRNG